MPEYLAPGLFVEEINSGSMPIEGVGTNTAAFIGYAKSGEYNKPQLITNWTQFCNEFGEEENALTAALCEELKLSVADVRAGKKGSRKGWTEFSQDVVKRGVAAQALTVKNWKEFVTKYKISQSGLPYMEGSYLANSVRGYFDNGGGKAYIIRVATKADIAALSYQPQNLAAPAPAPAATSAPAPPAPAQLTAGPLLIKSKTGAAPGAITIDVETVGDGAEFKLRVTQGSSKESYGDGKDKPLTLDTAASTVNAKSKLIEVSTVTTETATRPDAGSYTLTIAAPSNVPATTSPSAVAPSAPSLPQNLASLSADDFVGNEAERTGLTGLIAIEDVNFITIPDLMAGVWQRESVPGGQPEDIGPEVLVLDDGRKQAILDIQCALVGHCEILGDRMAILDPIPGLKPQEMNDTTMNTPYNSDHGQGTIYYPWIKIIDPLHKGQQILCPPSGHIAGVWVRTALQRGVHKAPANESVIGAVALEYAVTKGEQELLNPNGINCIRAFPGQGIRAWGARTLATVGNPSWKYINVRRLFNYIEGSLERGLKWVVFEPNDSRLWDRVRRNIAAFLYVQWREGMLFGNAPAEAYYVKCDTETNPQETIDLGRLYCEIGVNPVKPAEFVIIRIGQWSSSSSVAEG
jgi:uncharacterized protein